MAYHPNKKGKNRAEFKHRSGHKLKSNGDYNKESVKTFDSGESDFDGSDSDIVEGKLSVKSDDVKTRDLWRQCFNNFRYNSYNKEGVFKTFSFHLCAYLYHRDMSKQCGE